MLNCHFGSGASGHYRLLCLWNTPVEYDILDMVKKQSSQNSAPTLVFTFSAMSEKRRRSLAHECRQAALRLLLLDTNLLLYLAAAPRPLSAFFHGAMAFTPGDPYTITGSVPTEMFFGRSSQMEAIVSKEGTSLVFGGRQLGKTALLRETERRMNKASDGFIVKFIDLTHSEQIGITYPPQHIWSVLAKYLSSYGVMDTNVSTQETFKRRILEWLRADDRRRILLLLDEADAFFEADRKVLDSGVAWEQVRHMKAIMDESGRAFKVVFAGLHDVQRTARDANTPLAQFGTPVNIGAFLNNEETPEARRMIEKPLNVLGYRFEPPDLATRVLAYTNYYPSLIQIFCRKLVSLLRQEVFDSRTTPPYTIAARHVERAYLESKKEILDRFNWSLDLDPRYRLLALVIALEGLEHPDSALGMSEESVRQLAMYWWKGGFEDDPSPDSFQTLLDEMIGLGILRRTPQGKYALRSSNVIHLLGSKEAIGDRLVMEAEREPGRMYEVQSFRRRLEQDDRQGQSWRRSPLTADQEEKLCQQKNGVSVLFGCQAAGLKDVADALRALPQIQLVEMPDCTSYESFQSEFRSRLDKRTDGLSLYLVPTYDPIWVKAILEDVKRQMNARSSRLFRVLFLGNTDAAWKWISLKGDGMEGVESLWIKPWGKSAINHWLDLEMKGNIERQRATERLAQWTGGWSRPLHLIGEKLVESSSNWKIILEQAEATPPETGEELAEAFGLRPSDLFLTVLKCLAKEDEPLGLDDLQIGIQLDEGGQDLAIEVLQPVIHWAELLGYVTSSLGGATRREEWELNPRLKRALKAL